MLGLWFFIAVILSFLITWLSGKKIIPYLHKLKYGQTILEIGPTWHKKKQGTPTMGGLMFILGIFLTVVICLPLYYLFANNYSVRLVESSLMISKIILGLLMALAFGAIGYIDDYIKIVKKRNLGLNIKQKLLLQFIVAIAYLALVYFSESMHESVNMTRTIIPFFGNVDIGFSKFPATAILIVGMVNAVNLTDGIDGLSASITCFVGMFLLIIASFFSMMGISIVTAALIGACFGFLMWNLHPAKVFMGDTGSLFLGGMICSIACSLNMPIILIFIGGVYIMEMFSVMLQVIYFKLTRGKRLFKMSPIHHHFELCGWSEYKICMVFCLLTVIFGILAVILVTHLVVI